MPTAHALVSSPLVAMVAGFVHGAPRTDAARRAARAGSPTCTRARRRRSSAAYPAEVQPLVDDLNALLDAPASRRSAARVAKAGDLAHGLKTPLAVLAQEAERAARRRTRRARGRRSASRSSACGGRSTTTSRTRAPPRPARRPARARRARRRSTDWPARCSACTPIAAWRSTIEVARGPRRPRAARGSRRDARQPARQRLQVGAARASSSRRTPYDGPIVCRSRSTTMDRASRRRCATRCCSAASAPTKPRRAPASAWRSSASWRSCPRIDRPRNRAHRRPARAAAAAGRDLNSYVPNGILSATPRRTTLVSGRCLLTAHSHRPLPRSSAARNARRAA